MGLPLSRYRLNWADRRFSLEPSQRYRGSQAILSAGDRAAWDTPEDHARWLCCLARSDVELQKEKVLPVDLTVQTNKYLNNIIEQDHRRIKQRVTLMLGFKRFDHAVVTITGSELVHQIKKGQFDLSTLCSPDARVPYVWEVVLAA